MLQNVTVSAGVQNETCCGDQNETGSERVFSQDIGPAIERGVGCLGYNPELAQGMVNEGNGMPSGGADRAAATEEVDLVVGCPPKRP
jgi:hypothetical protein